MDTNITFGLDIGIASVGWAVLNESRVVDLGVRAFDKSETVKEGDSCRHLSDRWSGGSGRTGHALILRP